MKQALFIFALWTGSVVAAPSQEQMSNVRVGMTPVEVEKILGRPTGGTVTYGRRDDAETVSGWSLPTRGRVRAEYFNVHYRDGKVVRTSRTAEYPD